MSVCVEGGHTNAHPHTTSVCTRVLEHKGTHAPWSARTQKESAQDMIGGPPLVFVQGFQGLRWSMFSRTRRMEHTSSKRQSKAALPRG